LGIVAEPYRVPPNHAMWISVRQSGDILEASCGLPPCTLIEAGEGFVAVRWGRIVVFGIYLTPRLSSAEYSRRLETRMT